MYYTSDGGGYLIASSQGSDDYVVFARGNTALSGPVQDCRPETIDGTSGTDGIDVTNAALGDAFPEGLFVAQDGRNTTLTRTRT